MTALWALLCACTGQTEAPRAAPPGTSTERGLYRVSLQKRADGLELRLTDAEGQPIEDAALTVQAERPLLVDPGECDSVGETRCLHPAGLYLLKGEAASGTLEIEIDADPGLDRGSFRWTARSDARL